MQQDVNLRYAVEKDNAFIVRYFEDFYGEIVRQKALVLGRSTVTSAEELGIAKGMPFEPDVAPSVGAEPSDEAPARPKPAALPEQIIAKLLSLLNAQAADAARYGGEFAAKYYREAEFVMAALADEIFLHLEWSGKEYWEKNLLESQLYNTHRAGESFFERIDEFLKTRDPSRADLAMLYLLALGLGFKGKFRDATDQSRLAHYRRELFIFINHRDPTLFEKGTLMFDENYVATVEGAKVTYFDDTKPWVIGFCLIGVVMLFISYIVWNQTTYDINTLTRSIIAQIENN